MAWRIPTEAEIATTIGTRLGIDVGESDAARCREVAA
jgi:hypothetical protein